MSQAAKRRRIGDDAVVPAESAGAGSGGGGGGVGGIFQEGDDDMGHDDVFNEDDPDDGGAAKPPQNVFAPMSRLAASSLCIKLISAHGDIALARHRLRPIPNEESSGVWTSDSGCTLAWTQTYRPSGVL